MAAEAEEAAKAERRGGKARKSRQRRQNISDDDVGRTRTAVVGRKKKRGEEKRRPEGHTLHTHLGGQRHTLARMPPSTVSPRVALSSFMDALVQRLHNDITAALVVGTPQPPRVADRVSKSISGGRSPAKRERVQGQKNVTAFIF